jgi:hypothetical protein
MPDIGTTRLVIMWTVKAEDVAAADKLFESHAKWMTAHPREGDTALLSYSISRGPELSNPMDPTSTPTGNTLYVLDESYASPAGIPAHWQLAQQTWQDLGPFMEWNAKTTATTLHNGTVIQSLWQAERS